MRISIISHEICYIAKDIRELEIMEMKTYDQN